MTAVYGVFGVLLVAGDCDSMVELQCMDTKQLNCLFAAMMKVLANPAVAKTAQNPNLNST